MPLTLHLFNTQVSPGRWDPYEVPQMTVSKTRSLLPPVGQRDRGQANKQAVLGPGEKYIGGDRQGTVRAPRVDTCSKASGRSLWHPSSLPARDKELQAKGARFILFI